MGWRSSAPFDGTHVGASLERAAVCQGITVTRFDMADAMRANRLLRAAFWRFGGHRPARLDAFSAEVVAGCARGTARAVDRHRRGAAHPLGAASAARHGRRLLQLLDRRSLEQDGAGLLALARPAGIRCRVHDPLGKSRMLAEYRRCRDVRYLPFGYDDELFPGPAKPLAVPSYDVLFVGGADRDRISFITQFLKSRLSVALVGGYWDRCPATRPHALGLQPPEILARLTAASRINLCLVRRANRDGHVMRSFEIPALGGAMLAEDTAEHRDIFGRDGQAVVYFRTPEDAVARARELLADAAERARLSAAARQCVVSGGHTYRDRLNAMLAAAARTDRRSAS